ncbi:portal protein [Tetraselmis viridis virus SI1]|uniref:portal protein n=1 Tax=Tetraselmis viridis virus S20 TaxID=754070 RepID=UPI0002C070BC|nr:portal protein [Tetraselmis viridis virus S20]AGH31381.1 portal protein [Tetraselmis viridis virus S20]AGH31415.1 portal protein [Tetraselmis viridis virus SI1]
MSILGNIFSAFTSRRSKFWAHFSGGPTWAGEVVNAHTAMQLSATWAAIRITASTIATLPVTYHRRTSNGQYELANDDPMAALLGSTPNAEQTAVEFWEAMIGAMMLVGNAFARLYFTGKGATRRVSSMEILDPVRVKICRDQTNGIFYEYSDRYTGEVIRLQPEEMFHLKNFSFDQDIGMSTVSYGAQTLSSARASDKTSGRFFKKGMLQSGFIESPPGFQFNEGDRERFQELMEQYQGTDEAGGIMLLYSGMKFNAVQMNPEDAQLLASRKFNIEEICRWFGIPPILIGHAGEGQTMWGSGVEQIIRAWYMLGLRQLIQRTQAAVHKRVLSPAQRASYQVRFNVDGLLAGDSETMATVLSTYTQNGLMTRNEGRARLNLPPIDGGEMATAQVNLVPLETLGQDSVNNAARSAAQALIGMAKMSSSGDGDES